MCRLFRQHAEHIGLADRFRFRMLIGGFQRFWQRAHQGGTVRPQTVKRAGHHQLFQHAAVKLFGVGTGAQVEQLAEVAAFITRFDDRFNRAFAHAFNGTNAIDDFAVIVDVELILS